MTDELDRDTSMPRLIAAINGIRKRMPQCHRKLLDDYRDIVSRWDEGKYLFPGIYPRHDRCLGRRNARGIVLYQVGLAVARLWDLMLTDETVGLSQLLAWLEYYSTYGWDKLAVIGNVTDGYWLESKKVK